jgi:hypothetical protein
MTTKTPTWGPCGTCQHANTDDAPEGMAFCAAPYNKGFPFLGGLMPVTEGCTKWEAK